MQRAKANHSNWINRLRLICGTILLCAEVFWPIRYIYLLCLSQKLDATGGGLRGETTSRTSKGRADFVGIVSPPWPQAFFHSMLLQVLSWLRSPAIESWLTGVKHPEWLSKSNQQYLLGIARIWREHQTGIGKTNRCVGFRHSLPIEVIALNSLRWLSHVLFVPVYCWMASCCPSETTTPVSQSWI